MHCCQCAPSRRCRACERMGSSCCRQINCRQYKNNYGVQGVQNTKQDDDLRRCSISGIYRSAAISAPSRRLPAGSVGGSAAAVVRHPCGRARSAAGHPCRSSAAGIVDLRSAGAGGCAAPCGSARTTGAAAAAVGEVAAAARADEFLEGLHFTSDGARAIKLVHIP